MTAAPQPVAGESVVLEALATVPDPEIPACSIVDLGLIHEITLSPGSVLVTLLPTFAGCPALDTIRADAVAAVRKALPDTEVEVRWTFDVPWTTDRIAPAAREAMAGIGIAPPGAKMLPMLTPAPAGPCPYCGAEDTVLESGFGPTPCRAVAYCPSCRNPFEVFKAKR